MPPKHYSPEIKEAARGLYLQRMNAKEICAQLNLPARTLYQWAKTGEWEKLIAHEGPEEALGRRLAVLAAKEEKSAFDLKEIDCLLNGIERLARLRERKNAPARQPASHSAGVDENGAELAGPPYNNRKRPSNKKAGKNDLSLITPELYREKIISKLFPYQQEYRQLTLDKVRNAFILKSRQIGFSYAHSLISLERALFEGVDQNYLSATRAQSHVFRDYIVKEIGNEFDITITGDPLHLKTARGFVDLRFLSTSSRSAQSYHGDVTIDEAFWIPKYTTLRDVALGMASHAKYLRRIFSTPSVIGHQAYPHWTGAEWQEQFKKPKDWPTDKALRPGIICPDTWYRRIITLQDAERMGCNLFDIRQLKLETALNKFKQLYECQFIDDAAAVFALALLELCMADPADWEWFKPKAARPIGNAPVWCGYDPAHIRDDASFSVLQAPIRPGDKLRVLERHKWEGQSYLWQVERIKEISQRYNIMHVGVDVTGPGIGVFENIRQFLPGAMPLNYSSDGTKSRLVLKGVEVMESGRLEYDAADTALTQAFLGIRQSSTERGGIIYVASRTKANGHMDAAWSVLHGLAAEPLARQSSGVVIAVG